MKTIVLSFFFLLSFWAHSQESLSLEDDFKLDPTLLNGLVLTTIPEELHNIGITQNPGVFYDKNVIRFFTKSRFDNVLGVYFEAYESKVNEIDDAGVVVTHFESKNALEEALTTLINQSNVAYLIKDNFLIEVWSDVSRESEEQIASMTDYYRNKLQAELYEATNYPPSMEAETIPESEVDPADTLYIEDGVSEDAIEVAKEELIIEEVVTENTN